ALAGADHESRLVRHVLPRAVDEPVARVLAALDAEARDAALAEGLDGDEPTGLADRLLQQPLLQHASIVPASSGGTPRNSCRGSKHPCPAPSGASATRPPEPL